MFMTAAIRQPTSPVIEYPDSDGEPMAENTLQYKWIVTIKEGIEAEFAGNPHVFVAADLFWYPVEGQPGVRTAPDALVAFGRPKGHRGSYKQWVEGGIAPQVVVEVLSPGNRGAELDRKFEFYARYGVEEYYIYDPDDGSLSGWQRRGNQLVPVARMDGFVSPRLGIRFEPGEGPDNLRIIGADGKPFITPLETFQQLESESRRAELERQRADSERRRAEAAEERAESERERAESERERAESEHERAARLAAKLRELGIEPD
jgi:Uma2 family endonuclease